MVLGLMASCVASARTEGSLSPSAIAPETISRRSPSHTYRAQDDARRLSLEHQLKELLQELRAMGVSEEDIQALCREGDAK